MTGRTDAEAAMRERSRTVWDDSRSVGEWLIHKLAPRNGDIVLELAAGVGDTGFVAARLVGDDGRVLITDFAPEMVAAARRSLALATPSSGCWTPSGWISARTVSTVSSAAGDTC